MSYNEYYDLFYKCQEDAPFHLFVFDMKDSKKDLVGEHVSLLSLLIYRVYEKIEEIEKERDIKILHHSDKLTRTFLEQNTNHYALRTKEKIIRGDSMEPFLLLGDTIGLTIMRGSLTEKDVYDIFDQTKDELDIEYDFHYANGFYETDDYVEGKDKLFRGYAIHMLSTKHKNKPKQKTLNFS